MAELACRAPLVDAAAHVLGETVELSALTYRAPQPGFGAQRLHVDAGFPAGPGRWIGVTVILALVDFTDENGRNRSSTPRHALQASYRRR